MICFCVLYAPQPMLSELADRFMVSKPETGLLVSVTLIPLAISPLSYGIFLKQLSALTIRKWAIPALATASSRFVQTYEELITPRLTQGALLPAIMTALMAYLTPGREGAELRRLTA